MNLEGLIPILGGTYALLIAFKVVPVGKDPEKAERWHQEWGDKMKILSPIVIAFGVALLLRIF